MSKKLKVPSSARRHIRFEKFSSFVSAARLRHVQNILTNSTSGQKKIDGLLCIAGIDSRYNDGMSELLHYLLFGFFQTRKKEIESSGFPEEVIDDLMILVCPDHVQIYCNPINYHYLLPYTSHWPSVQYHCLSEDEYSGEEDDEAEEFKIRSFIAMVSRCPVIGVPYSRRGFKSDFNIMTIEKWPIVQAYALDDFGGGGFFTMKHEVIDVSDHVHCLEDVQDPVSLEILLTEQFPLLERQWSYMMKQIDMILASNSSTVSQAKVSEPICSYFSHGLVSQKGRQGKAPFVAFTRDTESSVLKKVLSGDSAKPHDLVMDKSSSLEIMIFRVTSPHSAISLTRTYFFCQPYHLEPGTTSQPGINTDRAVLRYVTTIYLSMVNAVLEGIEEYSRTASSSKAKDKVMLCLQEGLQTIDDGQLGKYLSKRSCIELTVELLDGQNRSQPLEEGQESGMMKYISLVLMDVPGPRSAGHSGTLGSLAFGETFLDSRILMEGSSTVSSDVLCVTSSIPRCHLWSIVVTILTGAPGCEKNTLCSVLTSYNKHLINWLVYKQPEESSVNTTFLHRSMMDAVQVRDQSMTKATRVVLIAPGFCDTTDVIRILFSHPDAKIRSQFSIGAVTLCIDPRNTFMEHKMTLPMLTTQCCQGWVNNILFTSLTQAPSELLDGIQNLIRSINPDVALIKAEDGEVKRSTDLDLVMSETAFNEETKEKARLLMKPYWSKISHRWSCQPQMKDVVLKFSHPLEKHLLLIKLRTLKASLKGHPFQGNIYYVRGFLAFSHSPVLMDIQFTPLSGKMILNESRVDSHKGDTTPIYIMSFTGMGLDENMLKGLLRTCIKQKPDKKPLMTKKDLSAKDIKKIHETYHLEELPDGWFYNGSQFISMSGERSQTHPSLDQFIAAHVAQKNVDIQKYNARIDADVYIDLFP